MHSAVLRLLACLLLLVGTPAIPVHAAESLAGPAANRGLGGWGRAHREKVEAAWYYNWGAEPDRDAGSAEFVPMIKGNNFDAQLEAVKKHVRPGQPLLCLNEPERKDQGNMTVERAIEIWPRLMETGARLSSPAPSSDGKGMAWLDAFMKEADKRKLRVDFIAIHWYRSADPADFEGFLKELHRKYRRPIWVTEFNGWKVSDREHERFLKGALRALSRLSFVERYAYFTWKPGTPGSLFKADGSLSELGELYRKAD
jgi:hypothetical protein